ncbi:MAG TPA: adenosine deaminase [Novosphingobium sp.]|nr:adenosine deaminase [Novosphingobium sp.]
MTRAAIPLAVALVLAGPMVARAAPRPASAREAQVAQLMAKAASHPAQLRVMMRQMPKGGDLHNHLGGSIYAEDFLHWAAGSGLCANAAGDGLVPGPCAPGRGIDAIAMQQPFLYARLVDALSTRGWQHGVGANEVSGHTQFFATFDKFGIASRGHDAQVLAITRQIAAGDHVLYLELDHNPEAVMAHVLATPDVPLDAAGLEARYAQEMALAGPVIDKAIAQLDRNEAAANALLGCGTAAADPACGIAVHYLTWGARGMQPAAAFRSLVLGFALAARDPRFVGVNIVQPEDWPVALRDYDLHMAMFRFLEGKYPQVRPTLHAGELAMGQVAPPHLRDHIAKAIAAGAQRIGHGTDIALEQDARATMATMARKGIAVEINLSSNDVILGVKGGEHPLNLYRRMGVPVVLATDDEGVLRTDMTNEYVRAVTEQGLGYRDLKAMARASITYSFAPGQSLWRTGLPGVPVASCAGGFAMPACRALMAGSEKARLEAALEARFAAFEADEIANARARSAAR